MGTLTDREHIMKKTATIKVATEKVASQIQHINVLNDRLHSATVEGNDARIEMFQYRIARATDRYFGAVNAFAFLFDASFDELEHMALESLGYGHIEDANALWEHTLACGM